MFRTVPWSLGKQDVSQRCDQSRGDQINPVLKEPIIYLFALAL